jgi:tetratricopeptide (TPR) repeat protein
VSGRRLGWIVVPALALALVGQAVRASARIEASRILRRVEAASLAAVAAGRAPRALFALHLRRLERAAALDPSAVGVLVAKGSQYRRPQEAIAAYRQALALEPRPEIHLNLARAYRMAGRAEAARRHREIAVLLDPRLGGSG